jgi:hypothetical protein
MGQWRRTGVPSTVRITPVDAIASNGPCRQPEWEKAMNRTLFTTLALVIAFAAPNSTALAQKDTATVDVEKDIALLRRNLRSEKKKIIAANLPLTETEATKFWPIYDQYIADITKPYDEFYSVIKDYGVNQKTLSDAQASDLTRRWTEAAVQVTRTRQKYVPIIEKVIPGKKAALFFQIDRRLYSLLELQVTSEIPLIVP